MPGTVRQCTIDDIESVVDLSGYSYSIPESSFERFREKWDSIFNEFHLNEVDGIPVSSARMIPLIQNLRGTMKPMGAIGLVAGSPEYRREGHTRELMLKMLEKIREKDYAVSCLYPFKDTFYSAIGYVKIPPTQFLDIDPINLSRITKPEGFRASRETGDEAFAVWRKLHDSMVEQTHGAAKRRDTRWQEYTGNFNRKIVIARNKQGNPEAIMVYSIKGYGEDHDWVETGEMNIGEMHWTSLEGRDTLLHFIYGHSDQIKKVKLEISNISEDYYQWLSDMHTPNITSKIVSMARIVDVKSSFNDLMATSQGSVILGVRDPHFEWNDGVFRFYEKEGILNVEESEEEPNTTFSIEGLTAVLYGTLGAPHLRRLGWIQGEDIPILDEWFPRATPWLTENF